MENDCPEVICKESPFANLRYSLRGLKTEDECPLNRSSLGNYSWSILHTYAAYYPQTPTDLDKKSMLGIL